MFKYFVFFILFLQILIYSYKRVTDTIMNINYLDAVCIFLTTPLSINSPTLSCPHTFMTYEVLQKLNGKQVKTVATYLAIIVA